MLKSGQNKAGICTRFFNQLSRFWSEWGPLSTTVIQIEKRFD